jgi:HPr kinase/phosphorylase
MDSSNPDPVIHGVFVNVAGIGVLIKGDAGIGKSQCALELITNGHKLIADDVVELHPSNDVVVGSAPERLAGLLEVRGLGIIDIRQVFGVDSFDKSHTIDVCIELREVESDNERDRLTDHAGWLYLRGHRIPKFDILVDSRSRIAVLVETAVRMYRVSATPTAAALSTAHDLEVSTTNVVI